MHRKRTVRVYVMRGDNLAKSPSAKQNKLDNSSNICTKPTDLTAFQSSIKLIEQDPVTKQRRKMGDVFLCQRRSREVPADVAFQ